VCVLMSEGVLGGVKASRVSRESGRKGAVFNSLKVFKLACEFWDMGICESFLGRWGKTAWRTGLYLSKTGSQCMRKDHRGLSEQPRR
jgi:hypothetical protein